MHRREVPHHELEPHLEGTDLAARARALLTAQKKTWELLRNGYASLKSVQTREYTLDGCSIVLQYNPGRIRSSGAKVDAKSIAERPCFLCHANLPPEQLGIAYENDYILLCNPYPIFHEHFTIPHREHRPQRIEPAFGAMLRLSRDLGRLYTVFYNGPKCGASAPDHMHFQAGEKKFMPLSREYARLKAHGATILADRPDLKAWAFDGHRTMISIESPDEATLAAAFDRFCKAFHEVAPGHDEPMMNVLADYDHGAWRVIIFPRSRHRPSFYFAEDSEKMLLSPASVDIAGVCVTPVERDFTKVTTAHLAQMFDEVCLRGQPFHRLTERLRHELPRP